MKSLPASRLALAISVMLLSLPGCSGQSDQPDLGQVQGTITLDGQPLSGVAVVFQPESGRPARGLTDAEGKYELTYIRQTRGAKTGLNRVEIAPSEEADELEDTAADADSVSPKRLARSGKPLVPARYNRRSELQADVQPGANVFDFQLTSRTGYAGY